MQPISRILIVDDEKNSLESLEIVLKKKNPEWEIHTAGNEKGAEESIKKQLDKKEPIDVVLTDLVMESENSGMNIIKKAREIDPYVMAILFTAKKDILDKKTIERVFEYGAIDVVDKSSINTKAVDILRLKTRILLSYRQLLQQQLLQQRNFLRQYFDPRVFDVIEKDPSILEVSQRTITIVFWDIRGFSKLCETLTLHPEHPKLISEFHKEYCELGANVVFKHNGVLDKFMGDGIMALFGVINHKDDKGKSDAISAVKAAIELRNEFSSRLEGWIDNWHKYVSPEIEIGLGCGIHTGEATVGNVGPEFRSQFSALGHNVNLASRIESESTSGQILVSPITKSLITPEISISPIKTVFTIKNITGKFAFYSVNE
ncbi:adenylate/guanylate cyclase [Candidatus Magnetobacterium bavaricum]|uniref:Adenylate/guanylate cyclase n=1 Tax=Candidatus Magnetobacterium bavaricum TaxID=29290 RepID=A0A0F3GYI0_9BACT|nr:adenylate/guanylate cyclase [Candidatus Magnetobacterium bavaricum]